MVRRVVTATDENGKAIVVNDGQPPISHDYVQTPGFSDSFVWRTDRKPKLAHELASEPLSDYIPKIGESVALTVTFPPGSVYADPSYDPVAAREEDLAMMPGLVDLFETDEPGMHRTPTADYAVVIKGQVNLELDDGVMVPLEVGDIVVQNGNRHAWRNMTEETATIFVVLLGAEAEK
ncbi:cupin domain-containing protein [Brevibacterium aurantiacum]|uniref:cupin domain-containing protein n=1 Tax=Brevibacterium aurantiacum TaxID=273384 RepID=UPI00186625A5|nr:cupin domain-containing protein [Brevibacterium aurantiacum]